MSQLVQIALDEINKTNGADYQLKDVYFEFEREVMTNATDNATIKKIEADTRAVEINILLSLASKIDNETVMKMICEQLDIDYELIKDKLPKTEVDLLDDE